MRSAGRIYLDTNIFILAFERRDAISDLFTQLIAMGGRHEIKLLTSELTVSELLVLPYRQRDDSLIDTYSNVIQTNSWLDVVPVNRSTLTHAAALRSQFSSLKLPDAIHLSTAIGTGCSHVLTDDRGIKGAYDLPQPFREIKSESAPLTIIRPDEPTLTSLLQSLAP